MPSRCPTLAVRGSQPQTGGHALCVVPVPTALRGPSLWEQQCLVSWPVSPQPSQGTRFGAGSLLTQPCPCGADPALPTDNADEGWCRKHGVSGEALRLAGIVRAELLEVMQRIELPISPPAFGTDANVLNIQRALISGYFLKVG